MLVIDNYLSEQSLREKLQQEAHTLGGRGFFWKSNDKDCKNETEKFCENIFNKFFPEKITEGFEYWVNIFSPNTGDTLDWHVDRDEYLFRTENNNVCPENGIVYYLHSEKPAGGMLEIKTEKHTECIMPEPNRLIVFNPNVPHRVTKSEGFRIALAANLWEKKPSKENFSEVTS